ncbi:MAG: hypothetical protein ACRBN8_14395 [Nannocystales bacterium]
MDPAPGEPRVAHYLYAHRAVPRAFLRNPAAIMGILGSDDGPVFLSGMWDVMDEALQPHERVEDTRVELECFALRGDIFVALVTMPPVARPLEAYFVACAARFEGNGATFARAFTLDAATTPGDPDDTGILEWTAEGERSLLEPRCALDGSAFVDALEEFLVAEHG